MTMAFHHRSPWPAIGAGALLLLLLSVNQVGVALHDADHPFHAHQSLCDGFLGAQLQTPGAAVPSTVPVPVVVESAPAAIFRPVAGLRPRAPQQPRAPPALPTR